MQFDLIDKSKFVTACDIAKAASTNRGVAYTNRAAPRGTPTVIRVGRARIATVDAQNTGKTAMAAETRRFDARLTAALVDLFPMRIRYSASSLPYHVGVGWFGGFLPATAFAIVVATGDIYAGLWYPVGVSALGFIVTPFLLPETYRKEAAE